MFLIIFRNLVTFPISLGFRRLKALGLFILLPGAVGFHKTLQAV